MAGHPRQPSKSPTKKTKRVNVYLKELTYEKLKRAAEADRRKLSPMAEKLLEDAVNALPEPDLGKATR